MDELLRRLDGGPVPTAMPVARLGNRAGTDWLSTLEPGYMATSKQLNAEKKTYQKYAVAFVLLDKATLERQLIGSCGICGYHMHDQYWGIILTQLTKDKDWQFIANYDSEGALLCARCMLLSLHKEKGVQTTMDPRLHQFLDENAIVVPSSWTNKWINKNNPLEKLTTKLPVGSDPLQVLKYWYYADIKTIQNDPDMVLKRSNAATSSGQPPRTAPNPAPRTRDPPNDTNDDARARSAARAKAAQARAEAEKRAEQARAEQAQAEAEKRAKTERDAKVQAEEAQRRADARTKTSNNYAEAAAKSRQKREQWAQEEDRRQKEQAQAEKEKRAARARKVHEEAERSRKAAEQRKNAAVPKEAWGEPIAPEEQLERDLRALEKNDDKVHRRLLDLLAQTDGHIENINWCINKNSVKMTNIAANESTYRSSVQFGWNLLNDVKAWMDNVRRIKKQLDDIINVSTNPAYPEAVKFADDRLSEVNRWSSELRQVLRMREGELNQVFNPRMGNNEQASTVPNMVDWINTAPRTSLDVARILHSALLYAQTNYHDKQRSCNNVRIDMIKVNDIRGGEVKVEVQADDWVKALGPTVKDATMFNRKEWTITSCKAMDLFVFGDSTDQQLKGLDEELKTVLVKIAVQGWLEFIHCIDGYAKLKTILELNGLSKSLEKRFGEDWITTLETEMKSSQTITNSQFVDKFSNDKMFEYINAEPKPEQWRKVLEYLYDQAEKSEPIHPNFNITSQTDFKWAAEQLDTYIKNHENDDATINTVAAVANPT